MDHQRACAYLIKVRKVLKKPLFIPLDTIIDLETAFLPVGLGWINLYRVGELTHTRCITILQMFVGYRLMNRMDLISKDCKHPSDCAALHTRAFQLGTAFVWALPNAPILSFVNNLFVGHEAVMKGILEGNLDLSLVEKYEKEYHDNGDINAAARKAVADELSRRNLSKIA